MCASIDNALIRIIHLYTLSELCLYCCRRQKQKASPEKVLWCCASLRSHTMSALAPASRRQPLHGWTCTASCGSHSGPKPPRTLRYFALPHASLVRGSARRSVSLLGLDAEAACAAELRLRLLHFLQRGAVGGGTFHCFGPGSRRSTTPSFLSTRKFQAVTIFSVFLASWCS